MITIAEATAEAIRLALLRHKCHAVCNRLSPYQNSPDDARAVAHSLSRTLGLLAVLRGSRRAEEVRRPEEQAGRLEARLADLLGKIGVGN
jgi:hypothetical protein